MLMIEYVSGAALAFVILQLWLMGSKHYRSGWWAALVACVLWAAFSLETEAWFLLAQQGLIAGLSIRALRKLREPKENSGLPRRNVVESKHHRKGASKQSHIGDSHDPITGEVYDDLLHGED